VEIVAQLLDDLDDLLCALPLLWERARRVLVSVGLTAAMAVSLSGLLVSRGAPALALLALIIAVAGLIVLVAAPDHRLRRQRV
jgi:hypothetical protein